MNNNFDKLLDDYRSIWNNRLLPNEGKVSEEILYEAIKREINDENSHPRIRRTKYEKFFLSTKRIIEASLSNETKLVLIEIHKKILEES